MAGAATLQKPGRAPAAPKAVISRQTISSIARRSDLAGSDVNLDLNTLGGRLAQSRLRKEMTQDQLAKAVDKVRATIVAYERGDITPPIPVVELIANALNVSPAFLAFGVHVVKEAEKDGTAISIDEITYGRDGPFVSGNYILPVSLAREYAARVTDLSVYVLGHNAEAFNLRSGDRLFTDTSVNALSSEFDTYVIETRSGMEIVRIAPSFAAAGKSVLVEGPRGDKIETRVADLKIMGAVVSTLRQQ